MKLLRCPGGYSVPETLRRVRVRKIILNPNTTGTAIECHLQSRDQKWGKYLTEFHAKDANGNTSIPYNFFSDPITFDNGIRAATLTNIQAGSSTSLKNGVQIYVD